MSDVPEEFVELTKRKAELQYEIQKLVVAFENRYGGAIEVSELRIERMRAIGPHQAIVVISELIVRT